MKNSFTVFFQNRYFSTKMDPGNLKFQVDSYKFKAIGGCDQASISVTGGELGIWDLINWLRFPVTIYDPLGIPVWWGYVHEVAIQQGALEVAANLDSMFNRVAVAYSYVAPDTEEVGMRKTTAWADNLDSQAEFGIKELLSSASGLSDAAAENQRAAILAGQAWPQGGVSQTGMILNSGSKKLTATLTCRGWWETLGWKHATIPTISLVENLTQTTIQVMGTTTAPKVYESIKLGVNSARAKTISVYAAKIGTPTDNLRVNLYNFWPDVPQIKLASGTIAGASMTGTVTRYDVTLDTEWEMESLGIYALVIDRSGAADYTNYYSVAVDTGLGYTSGVFKIWNGSVWVNRSPNADLTFNILVNNQLSSTVQIVDLISQFGQFLTATDLDATGPVLSSYQNGDLSALTVVLNLLKSGGANGRRLLSSVDPNRRVQIFEEPATSTASYTLDRQARLSGRGGIAVNELTPPVGVWCRLKDIMPGVVDLTKLVDPSLQFIESATWSASRGASYEFKGSPGVDSLLGIGG